MTISAPRVPGPVYLVHTSASIWIPIGILVILLIWGLWPRKPKGKGRKYP